MYAFWCTKYKATIDCLGKGMALLKGDLDLDIPDISQT